MLTTTEAKIHYSIPAGTLQPGSYKLILQGRIGKEGTPFSLEVNLFVMHLPMVEIDDFHDMGIQ